MNSFDPYAIIRLLFCQVRQEFNLGMGEYFAALDLIKGEWKIKDESDLKEVLQLLWCHSREEQAQFQMIWQETVIIRELTIPSIIPTDDEPSVEHKSRYLLSFS